jgi:hypothetical protein
MTLGKKRSWTTRYYRPYIPSYGANTDDQDVINGTKKLATYLINHTSYNEATTGVSAIPPLLKSMAQSNMKSKPETPFSNYPDRSGCRMTPANGQKARHSGSGVQSTPVPSIGPLDAFFRSFSGYHYDPSIPPAESFLSFKRGLKRWNDWDGSLPDTWKKYEEHVYTRYQAALTKEFNLWFGTEDDIKSWHSLCRAIAIHPLPTTRKKCREVSNHVHNNLCLNFIDLRGVRRLCGIDTLILLTLYNGRGNGR